MNKLVFVTGNSAKAEYLNKFLGEHFDVKNIKLDIEEVQSLDLHEIAGKKAEAAYKKLNMPVLVEDVSLTFNALNGLPGPFIKWFLQTLGNEGMCKLISAYEDKSAKAEVVFALCDEKGVHVFPGETEGTISEEPRGETNFGWDPIFIPKGHEKTWAEMSIEEKHETSMRKEPFEKLKEYLNG